MAEQAAGAVASAVIGGVTDRALSTVIRKLRYRSRSDPAATHEKLQRLETLVLKLRCAVEVSEKHAIGSASLLEWRDRLREAAAEGGAVVLDFQRRVREEENGDVASTSVSAPGQKQPAGGGGGAGAASGALCFTRSALGGMAQRVRDATRRLFSADEDMKKLDSALDKMERLSPDITQFLMALQLEVSPELGRRPAKRSAPASILAVRRQRMQRSSIGDYQPPTVSRDYQPFETSRSGKRPQTVKIEMAPASPSRCSVVESSDKVTLWDYSAQIPRKAVTSSEITQLASVADEARENRERVARLLARVLERTLRHMVGSIKATDDRDMEGLEWLAEWAAVLREAVERGNAVLQTLRAGLDVIHSKAGGALEEDGELYCFVRAVQLLVVARNEPFFVALVDLCPRKP